jgi:hypothetical protein
MAMIPEMMGAFPAPSVVVALLLSVVVRTRGNESERVTGMSMIVH